MRRALLSLSLTLLAALPARAAQQAEIDALYDALRLDDVVAVMRDEGLDYGRDLQEQMFPTRGGPAWTGLVEGLYDADTMRRIVRERLGEELADVEAGPLLDFFTSELGARIVRLEIEARRELLDPSIEETARDKVAEMRADDDARLELLDAFVDANDLVEMNVVGAMNSNYAFYSGMMQGEALQGDMTEEQALSDVWAQEPQIRADTADWVYSYLAMAYQPLSDDDLRAYTALSETPEGQAMNQAMFDAFDKMYTGISRALGLGAARFVAGEDI